jgi:hypothetical protein
MTSTQRVLGSVVSLWRYPVKSMLGEELNAADAPADRAASAMSLPNPFPLPVINQTLDMNILRSPS